MSGPAPKPRAIRVQQGNPGHQPLPPEVPIDVHLPAPPRGLSKEARAEWRRVGKLLVKARLMTDADRAGLAAYCTTYARWMECEQAIQKQGMVIETNTGRLVENPHSVISGKLLAEMRRWLEQFGLTPAARTKVEPAGGADAEDDLAAWRRQYG